MLRRTLAATALAATFAGFSLAPATPAFAEEMKMPRVMTLSGHGEARMAPDMASVSAGVTSQAATAAEALAANTAAMTKVIDTLKSGGIAEKDIQTSNFSVQPRYDYTDNQPPKLAGYEVSNNVTVTVHELQALGGLLDKLVQAGSNTISGISFGIEKPEAAMDEARKAAAADARHKAEIYAAAAGVTLGPIVSISEQQGYAPPPMPMRSAMKAEMAAPVPVAAGEQTLVTDVTISWEIR
jgi:uncharacterized protein